MVPHLPKLPAQRLPMLVPALTPKLASMIQLLSLAAVGAARCSRAVVIRPDVYDSVFKKLRFVKC